MSDDFLIFCSDFMDIQHLPIFGFLGKLLKKGSFFLYAHISTVSVIVLFCNRLQTFFKVFPNEIANIGSMKTCRVSNFYQTFPLGLSTDRGTEKSKIL